MMRKTKNNEEESDSDFLLLHGINRSLSDNLQENKIKKNKKTKSEKYAQPKKRKNFIPLLQEVAQKDYIKF